MGISEARKKTNKAWRQRNYERISFNFPAGAREELKVKAKEAGAKSVNAYVIGLLGYELPGKQGEPTEPAK